MTVRIDKAGGQYQATRIDDVIAFVWRELAHRCNAVILKAHATDYGTGSRAINNAGVNNQRISQQSR